MAIYCPVCGSKMKYVKFMRILRCPDCGYERPFSPFVPTPYM